eukprot:TRINITY_DN952_c0_g3_i2.p1 TRINITY_DN952_c0_g3~~TRINITY_DN952_c0_g3_i2.p1  ORF type:complete len:617 (+),score=27.70 TRINITY_DN952_c0_g3_i2:239-1852(+)
MQAALSSRPPLAWNADAWQHFCHQAANMWASSAVAPPPPGFDPQGTPLPTPGMWCSEGVQQLVRAAEGDQQQRQQPHGQQPTTQPQQPVQSQLLGPQGLAVAHPQLPRPQFQPPPGPQRQEQAPPSAGHFGGLAGGVRPIPAMPGPLPAAIMPAAPIAASVVVPARTQPPQQPPQQRQPPPSMLRGPSDQQQQHHQPLQQPAGRGGGKGWKGRGRGKADGGPGDRRELQPHGRGGRKGGTFDDARGVHRLPETDTGSRAGFGSAQPPKPTGAPPPRVAPQGGKGTRPDPPPQSRQRTPPPRNAAQMIQHFNEAMARPAAKIDPNPTTWGGAPGPADGRPPPNGGISQAPPGPLPSAPAPAPCMMPPSDMPMQHQPTVRVSGFPPTCPAQRLDEIVQGLVPQEHVLECSVVSVAGLPTVLMRLASREAADKVVSAATSCVVEGQYLSAQITTDGPPPSMPQPGGPPPQWPHQMPMRQGVPAQSHPPPQQFRGSGPPGAPGAVSAMPPAALPMAQPTGPYAFSAPPQGSGFQGCMPPPG